MTIIKRQGTITYTLTIIALLLRVAIIYQSATNKTFMGIVPDDSFYYLTIARNIASGLGSTFDQTYPTNGYHPLWMLMILPIMVLNLTEELSVFLVMLLGAFVWCAGAIPLQRIANSVYTSGEARTGMLALYLFAPFCVFFSINCLETSLVVFSCLIYGCFFLGCTSKHIKYDRFFFIRYGAICGIFFLSRTDSAIIIAIMTVALATLLIKRQGNTDLAFGITLSAITGLITISPWLIWNQITFGSIMQSSGTALTYFAKDSALRIELFEPLDFFSRSLDYFVGTFDTLLSYSLTLHESRHIYIGIVFFVIIFGGIQLQYSQDLNNKTPRILINACLTSYLVYIFVHAAIRWSVREWYLAIPCLLLYACITILLDRILPKKSAIVILALIIAIWSRYYFTLGSKGGFYFDQIANRNWDSIRAFDKSIPSNMTVGHSDSGIAGFLMKRKVINLDGLVNSQILNFYKAGKGTDYILENNIKYVFTREPYSNPLYSGPINLLLQDPAPDIWHFQKVLKPTEIAYYHFPSGEVRIGSLNAKKYLGTGWSPLKQGDSDIWSIGDHSTLFLPLHTNVNYVLTFNIMKYPLISHQVVTILFNGNRLATIEALDHWSDHSVTIPAQYINEGINTVNLLYSQHLKPSNVSNSLDKRPIALNLRSFRIRRCQDNCEPMDNKHQQL